MKSHDSISTILESKSSSEITNPTASDFALQNSQSTNFSSTILESFAGSLTFLAFPKADSSNDYSASAECIDYCAIATALARNDRKNNAASKKVDSSKNAAILNEQPNDSRFSKETCEPTLAPLRWFCDEKPLLCKPRKEIRLAVYRHSAAQQSKVYRAKPNPPAKFN